jgi:hypothetical protein
LLRTLLTAAAATACCAHLLLLPLLLAVRTCSLLEQLSYLDASTGEARDMAMLFDCKDSFEAVLGFVAKLEGIAEANPNFVPVITRI